MTNKEFLQDWVKIYQEILLKLKTIREEKEWANYPVSQPTENLMYLAERSVEFAMNAVEQEVGDE